MILPHIIEQIMVTAFYTKGVIGLNRLDEDDLEQIPILRQVVCLCLVYSDLAFTSTFPSLPLFVLIRITPLAPRDP